MRAGIALASLVALGAPACTLEFEEGVPGCQSYVDDFGDGVLADFWQPNSFEDPPATARETAGALVLSPAAEDAVVRFAGHLSQDLDFTNRSTRIRVLETPNAATNAQVMFKIEIPYPNVAAFIVEAGRLRARVEIGGGGRDVGDVPYHAAGHRFLRLRHRDDVLSFDTSPDGLAWTTLATEPMLPVTNARIGIIAGTYQPETAPGVARFDDFLAACR